MKKGSHLRLPFSIGLIVCSADIAFPHFLGFLTTFLFYPSLNNRGELLTLEYIWRGGGGAVSVAPPQHYGSSPCSSLFCPVFITRPLLLVMRMWKPVVFFSLFQHPNFHVALFRERQIEPSVLPGSTFSHCRFQSPCTRRPWAVNNLHHQT